MGFCHESWPHLPMGGLQVFRCVITPEMAGKALAVNFEGNRGLCKGRIERYASDLSSGLWRLAPDCIAFDESGRLINGQHRMKTIIKADVAMECLVITGMPAASYAVMDVGKARVAADLFHAENVSDGQVRASLARRMMYIDAGIRSGKFFAQVSNQQLLDYYTMNMEIIDQTHSTLDLRRTRIRNSCAGTIARVAKRYGFEAIREFCEQIRDNMFPAANAPANTLTRFLQRAPKGGGWSIDADISLRTLSALRAFIRCRPLEKIYPMRFADLRSFLIDGKSSIADVADGELFSAKKED